MIWNVARTALIALRRDRGAMVLSFVLPLAFFTIFAVIFGKENNSTPKVTLIVVDQDRSEGSENLVKALDEEGSLWVHISPVNQKGARSGPDYTAATAEAAVKAGDAPVALIIPPGFGQHPIAFGPDAGGSTLELLNDPSDTIAPQIVVGLLQKAAMTSMPSAMADEGMKYAEHIWVDLRRRRRRRWMANWTRCGSWRLKERPEAGVREAEIQKTRAQELCR